MIGYSHIFIIDKNNNILLENIGWLQIIPYKKVLFDDVDFKLSILNHCKSEVNIDLKQFLNHIHSIDTFISPEVYPREKTFNEIFLFFVADVYKDSWELCRSYDWIHISEVSKLDFVQTECLKIVKNHLNL